MHARLKWILWKKNTKATHINGTFFYISENINYLFKWLILILTRNLSSSFKLKLLLSLHNFQYLDSGRSHMTLWLDELMITVMCNLQVCIWKCELRFSRPPLNLDYFKEYTIRMTWETFLNNFGTYLYTLTTLHSESANWFLVFF